MRCPTVPHHASFLLAVALTISCVDHDIDDLGKPCEEISYSGQIQPIVNTKCAIPTCHNGDNGTALNWTEYSNLQPRALSGKLKEYVVNHIMPPEGSTAGPLSDEQISAIACWADNGAPDN